MSKRCIIVGGGECSVDIIKENIRCNDYIICADSGYDVFSKTSYVPSLVIGDFDSVSVPLPKNVPVVKLPVEKDITDCEAAIDEGFKNGCSSFVILGGTGGRFEHTFANISLIAKTVKNGYECIMVDKKHIFRAIHNSSLRLKYSENTQISVFAFGNKAYGVCERGFHYPLDNYDLDPFEPLGISNDIKGDFGEISVKNGTLVVIETKM